jgi:predicted small metal-binding protein
MTNENAEKAKADQSDSEIELKAEENYREFLCRDEYKGKECDFSVRAKTDDEVIELARMHQEMAHGVKDISPDLEKKIKANIRPASVGPIRPADPRIVRKSSLLDTCYTTSSGKK